MIAALLGLLAQAAVLPAPTGVVEGRAGDLKVIHIAVPDLDAFERGWAITTPGANITTTTKLIVGKPSFTTVLFSGCTRNAAGECHLSVSFRILSPDSSVYDGMDGAARMRLFDGPVPADNNIRAGQPMIGLRVEPGEALGLYRLIASTTDEVAKQTARTEIILSAKVEK